MRYILNRIKTPDGTILTSYHVHDYKTYVDKNGEEYMVDGGTYYLRRNTNKIPYEELSIDNTFPFTEIRKNLHWGTSKRIKDKTAKIWIILKDIPTDHIKNILLLKYLDEMYREFFEKELQYREEHKIL